MKKFGTVLAITFLSSLILPSASNALQFEFDAPKIHCTGCAKSIEKALKKDSRVSSVQVDVETKKVRFETQGDAAVTQAEVSALLKSQYSVENFKQAATK